MKKSIFLVFHSICLLLFLVSVTMPHLSQASPLKVLTLNFNAEIVVEDQSHFIRDHRFQALVDWIQQNDPDLVFIVEGWNFHQAASVIPELAKAVGYDVHYRLSMGIPGLVMDSDGILVKKKFNLRDPSADLLPHSTWSLGDGIHWLFTPGTVSRAVGGLLTLEDGSPLFAYSAHLVASSQPQRDDQILALDEIVKTHALKQGMDPKKVNVLLAGDFNSEPNALGIQKLVQERGYVDVFKVMHPEIETCTYCADPNSPNFDPMTNAPGQFPPQNTPDHNQRIDYIFAKGGDLKGSRDVTTLVPLAATLTFTSTINQVWMSDHFGIAATLSFNAEPPPRPWPNALNDRVTSPQAPLFIKINDPLFSCDGLECTRELPPLQGTAEKGLVVFNQSHQILKITLNGPSTILPKKHALLLPGKIASFYFGENQKVDLKIKAIQIQKSLHRFILL